jgi:hypothetical protein
MFKESVIICSGSQYAYHFEKEAARYSIKLLHRFNFNQVSINENLFSVSTYPRKVLDHPLGIGSLVRAPNPKDCHYVRCSWQSVLPAWAGQSVWSECLWWRWSNPFIYAKMQVDYLRIFSEFSIKPSRAWMPFFLLNDRPSLQRLLSIRINGCWHNLTAYELSLFESQADQFVHSPLLTLECLCVNNEVFFLQMYPGLPWGHFHRDPEAMSEILRMCYTQFAQYEELTIPSSARSHPME